MSTKDSEHLEWIYGRLANIHQENPRVDYMLRLRAIIDTVKKREAIMDETAARQAQVVANVADIPTDQAAYMEARNERASRPDPLLVRTSMQAGVIDDIAKEIHQTAKDKGWWDTPDEVKQMSTKFIELIRDIAGENETHQRLKRTAIVDRLAGLHSYILDAWPKRNVGEMLFLVVTELAEAYEEYRKGKWTEDWEEADGKPEGSKFELSDAHVRLFDIELNEGWSPGRNMLRKMAYNKTRPHRHGGKLS